MNRIRQINGLYQVLITPAMDYLLPKWGDYNPAQFKVEQFEHLGEAQSRAFEFADLDWTRMVEMHQPEYHRLQQELQRLLQEHDYRVDLHPRLRSPEELKEHFFDRVIMMQQEGNQMSLPYSVSDILRFQIVNPWSKNLKALGELLARDPTLQIQSRHVNQNSPVIRLLGKTQLNTTYEIQLIPTVVHQWFRWQETHSAQDHPTLAQQIQSECLRLQGIIDQETFYLR